MKKHTIVCGAVALALAPLLVGCGSGPGTIRGQSPAAAATPHQIGNHYYQPGHPYAQLVGHQVPGNPPAAPAARPAGCADGTCGGSSCSTCGNGGKNGAGCANGQCGVNGCDGNCDENGRRRPGPYAGGPYPGGPYPGGPYPGGPYPGGPYPGGPYPGGGMMQGGGGGNSANMWHPTHYHTFTYREPKNLVYPQQNQPAGVVQYPYYTVKGPDCFFLQ